METYNAFLNPPVSGPSFARKQGHSNAKGYDMNISGSLPLPSALTTTVDSVASRNLEAATKARRAFEVTQRDAEKTTSANSAGTAANGSKTADTLFHAQSIAQQFKDYMDKSPEELMRQAILKELGYDEDQLAAMDPKERAAVEQKIRDAIEKKIEESMREKGIEVDIGQTTASISASAV